MAMSVYKKIHQYFVKGLLSLSEQDAWIDLSRKEKLFYTYIKMRPDGRPFWVGKGYKDRAFSMGKRNEHYKNIITKYGEENIKTTIIPMLSEEAALAEESRLIEYFSVLGCKLVNMTKGGEGTAGLAPWNKGKPASLEYRATLSKAHKGVPLSPEHVERMARGHLGIAPWNKGKPSTPEHCANMSKSLMGRVHTPEHCANISKGSKGKKRGPQSPEHTEAIRQGVLGKNKGRVHVGQARENMLIGQRKRRARERMKKLVQENLVDIPYDPRPVYPEEAYRKA